MSSDEDKKQELDATRMTSPLASVQLLNKPKVIPGKDRIVAAKVQGWDVVVSKDFFKEDANKALCVFFEPDALLDPNNDEFKYLDSKKGRLIGRKKMPGGIWSQGLCAPLNIVSYYGLKPEDLRIGQDLTSALKVTKYVAQSEVVQYNKAAGFPPFPDHCVPKTDERNVQSAPELFEAIQGRAISVTLKLDGASMTVTSDGQICGRNYIWDREDKSNEAYFKAERKFKILDKIKGSGYSVQGELVGPKIQGNSLGLEEVNWFVFNVFYKGKYLPHADVIKLCTAWEFYVVPSLDYKFKLEKQTSLEDWMAMVDQLKYPISQKPAEGIVVKTEDHNDDQPRISFKIISRNYKQAA